MGISTGLFIKKVKSRPRLFSQENRYIGFYFLWLIIILVITMLVNALLLSKGSNILIVLSIQLFSIGLCHRVYTCIRKYLEEWMQSAFFRVGLTGFIYLLLFLLIYFYLYGYYFELKHTNPIINLLSIDLNAKRLSTLILTYLNLIVIVIFGLLPVFVSTRVNNTASNKDEDIIAAITALRKYPPFPYWERLIPLLKTILQEKMNTIVLGFLTNSAVILFLLVIIYWSPTRAHKPADLDVLRLVFVTFTVWLSSLAAWIFPVLMGLTINLEDTIFNTYLRKLRQTIHNLENHTVVLGYGDLGKITVKEIDGIGKKGKIDGDNYVYMLIPNNKLDFISLRKNFIVADKNEEVFRFVSKSIEDKIGIAIFEKEFYFPAVIGDINLPSTLEHINFSLAKIVLNVTQDENSTFSILNFPKRNKEKSSDDKGEPKLVLSFYKTSDKSYLITRGISTDRYYIYPLQVSGISLGKRLYSFYKKSLLDCDADDYSNQNDAELRKKGKTLIIGDGKQLFFAIESFWMGMKNFYENDLYLIREFFNVCVSIFADSLYLQNHLNKNKNACLFSIPRSVKLYNKYLEIPVVYGSPTNLIDLEKAIENKKPEFILISFDDGQKTLRVLHELLVIAGRKGWNENKKGEKKPYIIVSTREREKDDVKDVIFYWKNERLNEGYPKQYPDGIVDYYEGSKGMIKGLVKSLTSRNEKNQYENQYEVSVCVNNIAGATATLLTEMAGLCLKLPEPQPDEEKPKENYLPFFINFDERSMQNNHWCFNSHAALVLNEMSIPNIKDILRACSINAEGKYGENKKTEQNTREKIKEILHIKKYKENGRITNPRGCPMRQVCSLSTFSRRYESDKGRTDPRNRKSHEQYYAYDSQIPSSSNTDILGEILVCGNGYKPGTLATALNYLLFRDVEPDNSRKARMNRMNINYIQGFTCYDMSFSYHKIFGEIVKSSDREITNEILNACLIHPITCKDRWKRYAIQLYEFLNKIPGNKYSLYFDKKDNNPTRILLIKSHFIVDLNDGGLTFRDNCLRFDPEKFFPECGGGKWDCKLIYYLSGKPDKITYSKITWEEFLPPSPPTLPDEGRIKRTKKD